MWPFNVETIQLPPGYQSPINIMTRHVKVVDMPPLNTKSYDQISKYEEITCENNGHTGNYRKKKKLSYDKISGSIALTLPLAASIYELEKIKNPILFKSDSPI